MKKAICRLLLIILSAFGEWFLIAQGFTSLGVMFMHFQQTYLPEYGQGVWYVLKDDLGHILSLGFGIAFLVVKLKRELLGKVLLDKVVKK